MNEPLRRTLTGLVEKADRDGWTCTELERVRDELGRQRPKIQGRGLQTRKALRPVSPKRAAEAPLRAEVRAVTLDRAGHRCEGPGRGLPGVCGSPNPDRPTLETHEVEARGTRPGSHLDASLTVALCQRHHDYVTSPAGEARVLVERLGLLVRAGALEPVENTKGNRT